jgi:hypothetical protein
MWEAVKDWLRSFEHYHLDNWELIVAGDRVVVLLDAIARIKGSDAEVVTRVAQIWTLRGVKVAKLVQCSREEGLAAIRDSSEA